MGENDQGFYKRDVVDKPVSNVVVSGTDIPGGMLSTTPLSKMPSRPTGVVSGPSISADLRSALSSTGSPERRKYVDDVVRRKS